MVAGRTLRTIGIIRAPEMACIAMSHRAAVCDSIPPRGSTKDRARAMRLIESHTFLGERVLEAIHATIKPPTMPWPMLSNAGAKNGMGIVAGVVRVKDTSKNPCGHKIQNLVDRCGNE